MAHSLNWEHKIAKAIVNLVGNRIKPSNHKIQKITGGSLSTIQPIFKHLKERFNNFNNLDALCMVYQIKKFDPNALLNEKQELEKKLQYLEANNLKLAEQLSIAEQELYSLRPEAKLFKNLYSELKQETALEIGQIKAEKDEQINSLLSELAKVHQEHSKTYREFSYSKEEQAIQKEVQIIQLKDKLAALENKLKTYQEHSLPQEKRLQYLKKENLELKTQVFNLEQELKELSQ